MECPYCKEEIRKNAKKCKHCEELLGWRAKWNGFAGFVAGVLSVLVSLASLGIAFVEYQGRVEATEEKKVVEIEKQATEALLRRVPLANLQSAIEKEIKPAVIKDLPGFIELQKGELEKAIEEFEKVLEKDPKNKVARKGLLYAETLLNKTQEE